MDYNTLDSVLRSAYNDRKPRHISFNEKEWVNGTVVDRFSQNGKDLVQVIPISGGVFYINERSITDVSKIGD